MRKLLVVLFSMLFLMGITTSAYAAYSGMEPPDTMGAPSYSAPLTDGDDYDNGIGNANSTGKNVDVDDGSAFGDVIKSDNMVTAPGGSVGTQRTHGEYQLNTNSCASCHQTHTGAAKDLLFKQGVYNTCTACHDGTLGFYNVFTPSSAGTFGGTADGNASVHLADGTIQHKLAPGGNLGVVGTANGSWTENFDCASCHAPHGSYSDRLLHYSPNGMANVETTNQGKKVSNLQIVDTLPAFGTNSPAFVAYRTTAGNVGITGEDPATKVVVLMKKGTTSYVMDTTPWLYGYTRLSNPTFEAHYTNVRTELTNQRSELTEDLVETEFGKAYFKEVSPGALDTAVYADFARVYVVKLGIGVDPAAKGAVELSDQGFFKVWAINPDIYDETGYGVAIGEYCGACHTDYRAKSGSATGMYTVAWRHTTNNDSYTCLKCHYAHGTDVTVMKDAKDQGIAAVDQLVTLPDNADTRAYLVDKNPSSALKRFTNMAVCWKCHTSSKATQLKNNTYYWSGAEVPHGPNNW